MLHSLASFDVDFYEIILCHSNCNAADMQKIFRLFNRIIDINYYFCIR